MATASADAGAGGLPGQPPRRARGRPGHRLRLRAGVGGRLRPVPERAPDGAGTWSPPARCAGSLPWPRRWSSRTAPSRRSLFELGLRWFQDAPDTERFFAVRWDGEGYRLVVPPQAGTATRLAYQPPAGVVAEFHSHGSARAFFSATDDRDEQGFRIYGVVGRLDAPGQSCVSGSGSTATSPRWSGSRCSTARTPASGAWARSRIRHDTNPA